MAYRIDARMPKPGECVQRLMLEHWAAVQPDKVFAVFADGSEWTYAQTLDIARGTANALRKLGVRQGERVFVWLPNSADCLRVWFGLNHLGAVFVPLNLAYRGNLLKHALGLAEARLGIVHADLHRRLGEVELTTLREIVVLAARRRRSMAWLCMAPRRFRRTTPRRRRRSARSRRGTCSRSSSPRERPVRRRA